jgi:hypothetical protein
LPKWESSWAAYGTTSVSSRYPYSQMHSRAIDPFQLLELVTSPMTYIVYRFRMLSFMNF